ncbi:MAG: ABC transporter ATP-binding protein, partial [Solirubrobacteraceae bacterium]|nr:ABC transporter ATP-binding protein [Solirubrobacteraceae bacterium]
PDPDLLVLDEPTNGLDPAGIQEIRALLRALAAEGRTVFLSSHLLVELQTICDDLVVVQEGRHRYSGTVADLLATQSTQLRVRPEFEGDVSGLHDALTAAGVGPLQLSGGDVVVRDLGGRTAADVNRLAAYCGITLAELHAERPDLEATFLQLTTTDGEAQR